MNSYQISQMYRDHFKYNFGELELYELLGESLMQSNEVINSNRRYYLKLTSMQIVNVDCQSGLITDTEPLSIPLSKMINLFFLSKDQLQKVLSSSLCLKKSSENQLKLQLDQDKLRKNTYEVLPRTIREDYFKAPLRINLTENIGD